LTDVVALVLKPDLSISGPYPMVELPGYFRGLYYFDLITNPSDPQGEYVVLMVSPTEGTKDVYRIPLYQSAVSAIQSTVPSILNVQLGDGSGIANAVWSALIPSSPVRGSFGERIAKKLLTARRFLAWK